MSAFAALRTLTAELRATCEVPDVADDVRRRLDALADRLDQPLIVALAGRVKAGKSTLLNALIGERLAPTDAGECTRIVTWYRYGPSYRVSMELTDGTRRHVPFRRDEGALDIDLLDTPASVVERIVVEWPTSRLADLTLIDTPGLDSVDSATLGATPLGTDGGHRREADAVIYLMRHVHPTDLSFLEAFRGHGAAAPNPTDAIAVLSRADMLGACRLDALESAGAVARSLRSDPRVRHRVQTVVPVAGLLAESGATLREEQFRALWALAALPAAQVDELVLSVDRFVRERSCDLPQVQRQALLDELGLFGVRLALHEIRTGAVNTSQALAQRFTARSGVAELRDLLATASIGRREVMKAWVALHIIDAELARLPGHRFDPFRERLERIAAGAHDFAELHVLDAVRSGTLALREPERDEVEQLLSDVRAPHPARLGLSMDAPADHIAATVHERVARWRRRAENPISSLDVADAARTIARTYEAMLASAPDERPER